MPLCPLIGFSEAGAPLINGRLSGEVATGGSSSGKSGPAAEDKGALGGDQNARFFHNTCLLIKVLVLLHVQGLSKRSGRIHQGALPLATERTPRTSPRRLRAGRARARRQLVHRAPRHRALWLPNPSHGALSGA